MLSASWKLPRLPSTPPHTVELAISREEFNKIMQTAQLY